ncbi:MAG: hypothetical protein GXO68_03735 [Crenarchaeota archaeon]|nr:hypothetical protein [Thermoproteota archaeon]
MRAIQVLYLVLVMYLTLAETAGYYFVTYNTGASGSEMYGNITEQMTALQSNETLTTNPLYAGYAMVSTFLKIVAKSLTFQLEINGAPSEVNLIVRTFFFITGWLAFYDIVVLLITGVLSRVV